MLDTLQISELLLLWLKQTLPQSTQLYYALSTVLLTINLPLKTLNRWQAYRRTRLGACLVTDVTRHREYDLHGAYVCADAHDTAATARVAARSNDSWGDSHRIGDPDTHLHAGFITATKVTTETGLQPTERINT